MSTNTAEAETTESTGGDGPLLDLTDAGVKKFIKQAKARGYVTMDELNKVLPSEEVTSEAIEDTLAMLSEMGVNVVEAEEDAEGGEVAVREETQVVETTKEPAQIVPVLIARFSASRSPFRRSRASMSDRPLRLPFADVIASSSAASLERPAKACDHWDLATSRETSGFMMGAPDFAAARSMSVSSALNPQDARWRARVALSR